MRKVEIDALATGFCDYYEHQYAVGNWRRLFDDWSPWVPEISGASNRRSVRRAVHEKLFARGITTEPPELD